MPFIQSDTLKFLINQRKNYDMIIPVTPDGYHPLCAVYSKDCEKPIEELTYSGNLKVTNLFDYVKVKKVDFASLYSDCDLNVFFNINTNEDYLKAISLINKHKAWIA
jgi:molybdopterin-guanine dinucleotide biosynthesis protein A